MFFFNSFVSLRHTICVCDTSMSNGIYDLFFSNSAPGVVLPSNTIRAMVATRTISSTVKKVVVKSLDVSKRADEMIAMLSWKLVARADMRGWRSSKRGSTFWKRDSTSWRSSISWREAITLQNLEKFVENCNNRNAVNYSVEGLDHKQNIRTGILDMMTWPGNWGVFAELYLRASRPWICAHLETSELTRQLKGTDGGQRVFRAPSLS